MVSSKSKLFKQVIVMNEKLLIIPEPDFLQGLNDQQRQAVLSTEGPLLVLSGAGTGKTKVLTTRLANLIFSNKAKNFQILAVTFTNKAANEMKRRVESLIKKPVEGMYIGTFHSIGLRILRKNANYVNLKNDFTILDTDDQVRLLKQILSYLNLDKKKHNPKNYLYFIDSLKNHALDFDQISNHEYELHTNGILSKVYERYQKRLEGFNAVDFGDLILKTLNLLKKNENVLEYYQNTIKYILVDEYQDTNTAQYLLLRLLANKHQNICCVGDEDQSIYGWRGAQLSNILNFEKHFRKSKIIRLEQNYRSTGNILSAASSIISENTERIGKTLWTNDSDGRKVNVINVDDDTAEAIRMCEIIKQLIVKNKNPNEIAVLTRASFQFKEIEDRFVKEGIKYRVVGGPKFYDRKEIKDAIAYFRIIINRDDDLALERIINIPKRGLGAKYLSDLYKNSRIKNISLFQSLKEYLVLKIFPKKLLDSMNYFVNILESNQKKLSKKIHSEIAGELLEEIGYCDMLKDDKTYESEGRLENLKKLVSDINNRNSLGDFLEEVSLVIDNSSGVNEKNKISLMTLHSAKGLEFDTVLLPGWEEGIFPNQRNIDEYGNNGLEEERRLAYVGITRARNSLSIFYANYRKQYNQSLYRTIPSRFLSELPKKSCDLKIEDKMAEKYPRVLESIKSEKFKVGDKVLHENLGEGTVLGISNDKVQITFQKTKEVVKVFADYLKKLN